MRGVSEAFMVADFTVAPMDLAASVAFMEWAFAVDILAGCALVIAT
jgi:hypothetical protein